MELGIPVLMLEIALTALILGLIFDLIVKNKDLGILCLVLSTVFFFVGGACFLGVTQITSFAAYNETGAITEIVTEERALDYNVFAWLSIPMGFIPILYLYFTGFDEEEE